MESPAIERAPYGRLRESVERERKPVPADEEKTYYDLPALNPSHYGQLVASYLFIGGIAGASQVIATIADFHGGEKTRFIVRAGRYLALAGACTGPVFLVADLHTPERWYNMLRIFRRTSSMSIGSWTLALFGTISAITAGAQLLGDRTGSRRLLGTARALGVPAAASGAVLATYTGTLLGATSTPIWAGADRFLPALFGASAVLTSTAALSCAAELSGADPNAGRALRRLSLIAGAAEWLIDSAMENQLKRAELDEPLNEKPIAVFHRVGYKGLGMIAPLIVNGLMLLAGRRSRRLSLAAAAATLAGGYIMRSVTLAAGRRSAQRPRDYFRYTER